MRLKLLLGLWGVLLGGALVAMVGYTESPCPAARAPATWPAESRLPHSRRLQTMLMFLHPQCPCSRASLAELARLRARCPDVQIVTVCAYPDKIWALDLERTMQHITVVLDEGLVETNRFGALTSGQVLVYSPEGRLRYSGGLTGRRGHLGPSAGFEAAARVLEGERGAFETGPVFGCELGSSEFCGSSNEPTSRL